MPDFTVAAEHSLRGDTTPNVPQQPGRSNDSPVGRDDCLPATAHHKLSSGALSRDIANVLCRRARRCRPTVGMLPRTASLLCPSRNSESRTQILLVRHDPPLLFQQTARRLRHNIAKYPVI